MLIKDIAQALSARFDGDGAIEIDRLVHPDRAARPSDLALAMSRDAAAALAGSKAQAVVISSKHPAPNAAFRATIIIDEARMALATLTALFDPGPSHGGSVHATAVVAPDAEIGEGVSIGAHCVVGPRSRIGDGTVILSNVSVGADVVIGPGGLFHPGVRIGDRVSFGARAIVHPNAVIGSDGFSFAPDLNSPLLFSPGVTVKRVHSIGNVEIGDDVEIGACTTIDRSTLETTRIGRGTKIDNHVHIGHNVAIGESCIICGMVGISGSVTIGDRVRLGGGAGVADHVKIGDQAMVAAGSGVAGNVPAGTFVSGLPAMPHERTLENFFYMARQKRLHGKVDDINSRLEAIEQAIRNNGGQTK